jgi:hypothetical protein
MLLRGPLKWLAILAFFWVIFPSSTDTRLSNSIRYPR